MLAAFDSGAGGPVDPRRFVQAFVATSAGFRLGLQGDSAEALNILLDHIHEQLAPDPTISQLFYGQTEVRLICRDCDHESSRVEPWACLSLEIPGSSVPGTPVPTLDDCMGSAFGNAECLTDYVCDDCKERGTTFRESRIRRFPPHLIVYFKRFTATGAKVQGRIAYNPDMVDLGLYATFSCEGARYRVMSCVEHSGSCDGGHYYMRQRDAFASAFASAAAAQGRWLTYDDATVTQSMTGGYPDIGTYILFLERI